MMPNLPYAPEPFFVMNSRRQLSALGILIALILSLLGQLGAHADTLTADPEKVPMEAAQLVMTVQQSGVPQLAPKSGALSESKVRNLTINLRRIAECNGHVSLKVSFVGLDVVTKKRVVSDETTKDAEAVPGKGNEYSLNSAPFVHVFPSFDKQTNKPIPASGVKPAGWVVCVFQGDKLLAAAASTPELSPWLAAQGK